VTASLATGLGFATGRALPVLVLREETVLAERPQGLRVLRALTAATLALALVAAQAQASETVAAGNDPSAAGTDLAWQEPGVGGFLLRPDGTKTLLPGTDPAVGGAFVAWRVGTAVTVAARDSLTPGFQVNVPGVQKLAVSRQWLVYRTPTQIRVQALADLSKSTLVARAKRPSSLGRPALGVDLVVFHRATDDGSSLNGVNVAARTRLRLRFARDAQLLNPSVLAGQLLYVRASRCSQQLRLGPLRGGKERILFELGPLAGQDAGHDRHHTRQGEHLPCPHRPRPTTRMLWTTALSPTTAYVTILQPRRGGRTTPTLVAIPR
jgi:hypothetical protein